MYVHVCVVLFAGPARQRVPASKGGARGTVPTYSQQVSTYTVKIVHNLYLGYTIELVLIARIY